VTSGTGYVLQLKPTDFDLFEFDRLNRAGRQAWSVSNLPAAASAWRSALSLWRGPALAGLPLAALGQAEAARLEEDRLSVLEQRIDAELAQGQHHVVVGELRALVAEHPMRERLSAQLMQALWQSGRAGEALSTFAVTRNHLITELGIEPGPELKHLQEAILIGTPDA
jgi:DNA-binding SARP family transcriptional activator